MAGITKSIMLGVGMGVTLVVMFCDYGMTFYIGSSFVADGKISASLLLMTFFSIMLGSIAMGQALEQFAVISTAQGAAVAVYDVIDRVGPRRGSIRRFDMIHPLSYLYSSLINSSNLKGNWQQLKNRRPFFDAKSERIERGPTPRPFKRNQLVTRASCQLSKQTCDFI